MDIDKNEFTIIENCTIAVIGLGYVGLPLAVEFVEQISVQKAIKLFRKVIGFDINKKRIRELERKF